jgi:pyrimidine operon attenuation protein/uracil phosphoribosyltransferase
MSPSEIDRTLVRLAHEVLEKTANLDKLALVGIRRRGVPIARRLARKLKEIEGKQIPVGILDIRLYRDDLSMIANQPVLNSTEIPFSVTAMNIILVDDVLFTGRTVRAALNALFDHGRPDRVDLLALIDRGHREIPIAARYIGRVVETRRDENVEVKLLEVDQEEKILLVGETSQT